MSEGTDSWYAPCTVERPVRSSVAELRHRWPAQLLPVTFACATSEPGRHAFRGPLLSEVVMAAGLGLDQARRKDRSRFLLEVTGAASRASGSALPAGRGSGGIAEIRVKGAMS